MAKRKENCWGNLVVELDKQKQIEELKKEIKKVGLNSDEIDLYSLIDSTLEFSENKKNIFNKIGITLTSLQGQEEKAKQEIIKREEEHANQDFNKAIDNIVKNSNPQVSKHYSNALDYVKMVARNYTNALLLYGEGGLGKSHLVLKTLKEEKTDFEFVSGYITPLQLVNTLYQHNGALFFFDDCEGLFNDEKTLSILKSATWSVGNERMIMYNSSTEKLTAPSKFSCNSRFIFCLNQLPVENPSLEALVNRTLSFPIYFSFKEKIELFFEVAKQPYKNLSKEQRFGVIKFLKEHCSEATENLSIRTLLKGFDMVCYSNDWQRLLLGILDTNDYLEFIMQNEHEKPFIQVEMFREKFGLSQASFYRKKKLLAQRRGM